ncbi:methyltransferase family protein [Polymorphum gilvum]|uniref:Isoprenylcysteine carboxyl methyltransferase family protein n=1 Tax=Polymorphum gilvum (strain LMG 25793 / CGMCC 1.9160 / SL003B-26A1) TaxID=991905 RepID=F2IVI0_POLGS|nr:isoprenylcysteine carboxylmethyltransferase family protein [Polymorphum gilvum]ADZ72698.1 Isoprenylcysteine carboxyl methyltransferase family protein [Polymorphum gilvum SL003B-26A1]
MRLLVPPPLQAFLFAVAMALAARAFPGLAVTFPGQVALAVGLAALGLAIDLTAVVAFLRSRTTVNPLRPAKARMLVATGLYRFTRNPMYLGLLLVLSGWAVWLGHGLAAAIVPLFVVAVTELQIKPEEAALEAKFGEPYRAYRRKVRRWI